MVAELSADLRKDTRKTCVLIQIGVHAQNELTVLGLMVNINRGTYVNWTKKTHNISGLAPQLSGINPGFFK